MATRTFSGRADDSALAFADAIAQRDFGLSFGQYCSTVLLDSIQQTGCMPSLSNSTDDKAKSQAASFIKNFHLHASHPEIARLSDEQTRDLIGSRYE